MKAKIHINQHRIRANSKDGGNRPVVTVKTYEDNRYGHRVKIHGPSEVVYSPDKPLSCGAKVWIECDAADVEILDEISDFEDTKA